MSAVDGFESSDWTPVVVLQSKDLAQQYLEWLTDYGIDAELSDHEMWAELHQQDESLQNISEGVAILVPPDSLEEALDLIQERDDLEDVVLTRPDIDPLSDEDEDDDQAKKSFGMTETTEEELFFPEDNEEDEAGVLAPSIIDDAFDDLGDDFGDEFGDGLDDDFDEYPL